MVNQEQLYQANKAERQSIFAKSTSGQEKPMFEFLNPDTQYQPLPVDNDLEILQEDSYSSNHRGSKSLSLMEQQQS